MTSAYSLVGYADNLGIQTVAGSYAYHYCGGKTNPNQKCDNFYPHK